MNSFFDPTRRGRDLDTEEAGRTARDYAVQQLRVLFTTIRVSLPEILGAAYIWWWDKQFNIRQRLGVWAGWGLVLLIVIEVCVGPALHLMPIEQLSRRTRQIIEIALLICAITVVLHHWRLEKRLERHRNLVDAVRKLAVMAAATGRQNSNESFEKFVSSVLYCLAFLVEEQNIRHPCACAAMLFRIKPGEPFRIFEQSPCRYPSNLLIDGARSAAAKAATYLPEETLYIPWTRLRHGVKITSVQGEPEERVVQRRTKSEAGAMLIDDRKNSPDFLPSSDRLARRSLLLSRVPVEAPAESQYTQSVAVLCVETNKRACLGELDFHAIQVMGVLIGTVMKKFLK